MNFSEYHEYHKPSIYKSSPSFNHNFISNKAKLEIFYILLINRNQSFISRILKAVGPLEEKFDFFNPLGSAFNRKTSRIKFCSGRTFICYLKDKSLIHDGEIPTIFKFSAKNFDSKYSYIWFLRFRSTTSGVQYFVRMSIKRNNNGRLP